MITASESGRSVVEKIDESSPELFAAASAGAALNSTTAIDADAAAVNRTIRLLPMNMGTPAGARTGAPRRGRNETLGCGRPESETSGEHTYVTTIRWVVTFERLS
jgi:hypothetical protein